MNTPPYPPLDQQRWRSEQPGMPIIYEIELANPVFHVGPVPVFARPNGIGIDWMFKFAGIWKYEESTQGAVSAIEYLSLFDLTYTSEVLLIDLRAMLTAARHTVAHRAFDGHIHLLDVNTLDNIAQFFRMAVPYSDEVATEIAALATVYNDDVAASRPRPGGLHDPERYLATNWKPCYAYLKNLARRALFIHERFKSTIGRRK